MIRLRTAAGKILELPVEAKFIEITDLEGNVSMVISANADSSVDVVTSRDREARAYARSFDVRFCRQIGLPGEYFPSA